ncbi:hypothetical protein L1987_39413 [Smallanthus sonchifolius]|uniref:Uncharacterized protein n=1 Tax=Smallanthus sonchifolius TaxID=185202 RepID=A0ACB9HLR2_9ASTR|nr:hypothetical protein L1987_39413 [Smallanthus sonchifolius]
MACDFGRIFSLRIFIVLLHFRTLGVSSKPRVPCYFVFGDSWVDNGNNNKLKTKCKVNYPPYGIDFPEGSTGRFTNGRNSADIIGLFPSLISKKDIRKGVNYGSGCAGIRKESGRHLGDLISMDMQLRHHKSIISRLSRMKKNRPVLKKCVYVVNIGSNDYINNFSCMVFTIQAIVYIWQTLYHLGGRKIVVFGLADMGCTPAEIYKFGTDGKPCVESLNEAARLFNDRLMSLVVELNKKNSDARFTFINLASILSPLGDVPLPSTPCCHVRDDWQCIPSSVPCLIRDMSIFFDGFHPTEICNILLAKRSYTASSPVDAYPYDISHLAQL